ncbi:hypothetical protein CBOM_01372 [Ceraceosorus bombacis]|uniref:Uncharacterized protein n=1 Tax=Ceraceosorus bombacis TaxID=401625 RepID=A0A0P1BD35_9BASI|nr:hypothetical protein CBOM_01372 [Ceraceosorus bombacis]
MLQGMQLGKMLEDVEACATMDGFPFIPETSDWASNTDQFNLWAQITSARWVKSDREWLETCKFVAHNKTPATLGLSLSVGGLSRQQDFAPPMSCGPSMEELQRGRSASALASNFDLIRAGRSAKHIFANCKKPGTKLFFGKKRSNSQVKGQGKKATC